MRLASRMRGESAANNARGLLWCVGRELEDVDARSATILRVAPDTIEITWWDSERVEGHRSYSELEIRGLMGRQRRTAPDQLEDGLQELLRTLGRELDRRGVSLTKVDAQAQRFKVTGRVNEEPYFTFYPRDELRFLTRARRAERQTRPVTGRSQYGFGSS